MRASLLLLAAAALASPVSGAFESRLAAGLAVAIECMPEPVAVDGVQMTLQRVTGAGVPELVRRIEALWRSQGSEVKDLKQGVWILRSRMHGTRSEVLQWRDGKDSAELLWSSLDAAGQVQPMPETGLALPAGCVWGRRVSGSSGQHHYLQRTARCAHALRGLSMQLQRTLPPQGWRLRMANDHDLVLERQGVEGVVSLTAHPGDEATWLTWLRVEHPQ
jgi:hypothetical protein